MTSILPNLLSTTRTLNPVLIALLQTLKPGQRVRITQTVRVGSKSWPAVVEGVFRSVNQLETGLATDRVKADALVVVVVHFTKDNGELSSVCLDEQSRMELA